MHKNQMICYVTKQQHHKMVKIAQYVIQPETAFEEIALQVSQTISTNKTKMTCRIILLNDTTLQRNLQLPNIELTPYELNDYVSNTLAKIFHAQELLAYDYYSISSTPAIKQTSQVSVYALPKYLLDYYITQLCPWRINYIGIPDFLLSNNTNTLLDDDMQYLSCMVHLKGINFLPWREWDKTKRQNRLFIFIFALLIVLIMMMFWLTDFTNKKLNRQINKNTALHQQYLQKNAQLSVLKDLQNKNKKLQLIIHQNELLQLERSNIAKYLILISKTIPDGIWLNSLEYKDNNLLLVGQSHLYADIMLFCQQLEQHPLIQNSQITSIKHSASGIFFYIQLQFMQESL